MSGGPGPFDKYRSLPVDSDRGSPRHAYGAAQAHLVGDYWTVSTDVSLSDLSSLKVVVADRKRLRDIQKARAEGRELPPIEIGVFQDGSGWIVDGNHRLAAARKAGDASIRTVFTFIASSP